MRMLRMVGVCCVLMVGGLIQASFAAEPLPAAFEPIITASKARAEEAQMAVAEWKGKRDALVKQQKPVEKKIRDLGKKLSAERDQQLSAVNAELLKFESRLKAVQSEIKSLSPSGFKTTKEFAAHDKLTDERRSLQESFERLQRASFAALREFVRDDADGAKLVSEWERLDIEAIGAGNEATLVQLRRDSIVRAEGNLTNNTRYWLHNLKQDGFSYRLNARSQRHRYIGFKPEYHLGLLTHEDELRRRAWQVHHVGKPEAAPTVFSESLAHQGYYYLRSGWGLDDEFLYFQSIGQPIMSGREDNTGFSLYGQRGIHLLSPAPVVDGKVQNAHFETLLHPGGKTHFATYAWPNIVKTGRFHAGPQFDLCEGHFNGVYTYHKGDEFYDVFGSYGYDSSRAKAENRAMREGKPFVDEPIKDVRQSRRIISLRGRSTYIVTNTFESTHSHRFTQNFTVYTPIRSEHLDARVQALREDKLPQLISDSKTGLIATNNIGLPNLQLRHVSALPLSYAISDDRRVTSALEANGDIKAVLKSFSKRDRHHTDSTGAVQFSRHVAVNWEGQGPQVVVTIVSPQPPHYDATTEPPLALTDFKPLALSNEVAGFTAKLADGGDIEHVSAATSRELKLGAIKAHASGLTVMVGRSGIALDCTSLTINGTTLNPTHPDFTFHLDGNRLVIDEPIYRPIQPVVIEPRDSNVFTDSMQVTLSCPTPDVEIRYSLDDSKPTPQSPLYTGPFDVRETSLMKARAFRPGLKTDVWQQDGTHATSIVSAVFRKEVPLPVVKGTPSKPGLKYEFFSGVWTEVMTRSLTKPAQATGTLTKLLDGKEVSAVRSAQQPTAEQSAFGLRLSGYLNVPVDGVYTLHAPREFLFPDIDCGYDLRVFIDGHEWNPANRWHAHGNWSIALKKGPHHFRVVFADLRPKPHKTELMWGFPHPEFTWKGIAPQIEISGPGMKQQPFLANLLSHPES